MEKIFILFNPYTLGFDQMTTNADLYFIKDILNPDPNDVDRAKILLEEIKEKLGQPITQSERMKLRVIHDEILPYPFAYEIHDVYEDYETRRDFFLKSLLPKDPATHHILSHNKLRKRRIESVMNYTKLFGGNQDRVLLSQIEERYSLENPFKFQQAPNKEKSEVAKMVTRLSLSVMENTLLREKILVI